MISSNSSNGDDPLAYTPTEMSHTTVTTCHDEHDEHHQKPETNVVDARHAWRAVSAC